MGLLKKNIAVGIISLVFAACSNSSNSGESETSISKGDCFDVVNTQTSSGDLKTIGVKDFFGDTTYYNVKEVISEDKYLLINQETKDSVVAEVKDKQMIVVEVLEFNGNFKSSSSTKYSSSGKSSSLSSSSAKMTSSSSFLFIIENEEMTLDLNEMKLYDKRDKNTYDVHVDSVGNARIIQPLNYAGIDSSWCYNNYPKNCNRYGRLYTRASASTACPKDWALSPYGFEGFYAGYRDFMSGSFSGIGVVQLYWRKLYSSGEGSARLFCKKGIDDCFFTSSKTEEGFNVLNNNYAFSVNCIYKNSIKPPKGIELPKSTYVIPEIEFVDISQEYAGPYGEIIDERDGNIYKTVKMGEHTWMAENLKFVIDSSWCLTDDCISNEIYGRYYRWENANGLFDRFSVDTLKWPIQGVCPEGWHIPSRAEWDALFQYVLEQTDGAYIYKALMTTGLWYQPRGDAEQAGYNTFGFNILPSGYVSAEVGHSRFYGSKSTNVDFMISDDDPDSRQTVVYFSPPRTREEPFYYRLRRDYRSYPNIRCVLGKGYYPVYSSQVDEQE